MRKRETRQKKLKISTVSSARHFLFYIKIAQNCFFFKVQTLYYMKPTCQCSFYLTNMNELQNEITVQQLTQNNNYSLPDEPLGFYLIGAQRGYMRLLKQLYLPIIVESNKTSSIIPSLIALYSPIKQKINAKKSMPFITSKGKKE